MSPTCLQSSKEHAPTEARHSCLQRLCQHALLPWPFLLLCCEANCYLQGAYQAAVDAYLAISPIAAEDPQKLAPAWQMAVRLASQHLPAHAAKVAARAAQNLASAKLPEAAALLLQNIGDKRGALKVYCQAGLVAKARAVAAGDQALEDYITELGTTQPERDTAHGGEGTSVAELDDLARRGNWVQVSCTHLLPAPQCPSHPFHHL